MRSSAAVLVALTAMFAVALTSPAEAGIGVRVMGGISYISYGEYNAFVDDTNADMGDYAELDKINWVPEFGAEVYYGMLPSLDLGIGAGMLYGKSDIGLSESGVDFSWEHKMKSFPITATAYFRPPLPFMSFKPYVYGGVGLYYSKLDFAMKFDDGSGEIGYTAELSDWDFGLHGGAGVEISIVPTISLDIGVKARWAKLKGFSGTATNLEDGLSDTVFLRYDDDFGFGPDLKDNKAYRDEGEVDISGFMFYAGVKFGF